MNKALSTLTAAGGAGIGLALASTSAKAFVPLVLGVIIGGSVLGGAVLGSAASNANNANSYSTVASEPAVTVNSTTCYFTHRWISGVRHRVRVCTGQPVAAVPSPVLVPGYGYGYGAAVPAYEYGYYATAPAGHCDLISGQRVCFP
jgi:hypothetical protein